MEETVIHGRYRLIAPLGSGGMAEVWRAQDERLDRPVAIKFLAEDFRDDPENLVRFFSEAQSIARLQHPNVVTVLDFGEHEGRPYLVMDYVSGGTVADLIREPVLPERALEIVAGAAAGAGAAHALGIVHRDIKPSNILLDADGEPQLADFGIASCDAGEQITETGLAVGSPHYLSPEQAQGKPLGPPSDVYSLGVVLYELLTGVKPFDGDNVTAVAIAHVEREPRPPSALVEDVPPQVDELVLQCMAKDPGRRFADGGTLAHAIRTGYWMPPPSPPQEEHRRYPPRVLLGAAAAVVVALGLLAAGLLGGPKPEQADASDRPGRPRASRSAPGTPTPTPSPAATAYTQPVPSSEVSEEAPERKDKAEPKEPKGDDGREQPEEPEEPEEPEAEPTPEPTPEPSPEPTPTPAPTDAGDRLEEESPPTASR